MFGFRTSSFLACVAAFRKLFAKRWAEVGGSFEGHRDGQEVLGGFGTAPPAVR